MFCVYFARRNLRDWFDKLLAKAHPNTRKERSAAPSPDSGVLESYEGDLVQSSDVLEGFRGEILDPLPSHHHFTNLGILNKMASQAPI